MKKESKMESLSFLIAGSILFLASILAVCENIPFLEGLVNGLLGKMFTDSQLFAAYFYSQWVAGGLLVICGIAFLLSLKILKRRIERACALFAFE